MADTADGSVAPVLAGEEAAAGKTSAIASPAVAVAGSGAGAGAGAGAEAEAGNGVGSSEASDTDESAPAFTAFTTAKDLESILSTDYVDTSSGAKVSSKATLCGASQLRIARKTIIQPSVMLRCDLAVIEIEQHCYIGHGTVVRPPYTRTSKGRFRFIKKQTIRDHTVIGRDCVIEAACIGCNVRIGNNCVISKRCVLHDCCQVLDNTVLAPDTVVPPFAVFGGVPGVMVRELPPSAPVEFKTTAAALFATAFAPSQAP